MKAVVTTLAAVAALAVTAGAASAQNWQIAPNYGSVSLRAGFTPDPYNINLTAGGNIDVSYSVSSDCRGYVTNAPDVELYYSAGSLPLISSTNSSSDTTLVVTGPDGSWYCDDDGGEGLNASLRWNRPMSGAYHIWVGTYGSNPAAATLSISELYSY